MKKILTGPPASIHPGSLLRGWTTAWRKKRRYFYKGVVCVYFSLIGIRGFRVTTPFRLPPPAPPPLVKPFAVPSLKKKRKEKEVFEEGDVDSRDEVIPSKQQKTT